MCYRGIPPRGITAPSLSFEEVVVAHHRVLPPLQPRCLRRETLPLVSFFFPLRSFVRKKDRKRERERERERESECARFSLNRVTSRTKEYRLMTGCTLDSDIAPCLVILSTIKPGRDVPETGILFLFFLSFLSLSFSLSLSPSSCPLRADSVTRS
jgi:hypothetical protein